MKRTVVFVRFFYLLLAQSFKIRYSAYVMVVRMRHTRAHTANRRSHHALRGAAISMCSHCKAPKLRHTLCEKCGYYRGKKVVDTVARVAKKQTKKKAKK